VPRAPSRGPSIAESGPGFPLCICSADRSRLRRAPRLHPTLPFRCLPPRDSLAIPLGPPFSPPSRCVLSSFPLSLSLSLSQSLLPRLHSSSIFLFLFSISAAYRCCRCRVPRRPFGLSWTDTSVPKLRGTLRPSGAVARPKRPPRDEEQCVSALTGSGFVN